MLEYIKNDNIKLGEKIECYYSKVKNTLSVRKLDSQSENFNRIVAHTQIIHLVNVEFCYRGARVIVRGEYAGSLQIDPNPSLMVIERDGIFFDLNNNTVKGANYCVCYLDMILAEGCYEFKNTSKTM